ncbi:MAG: class I SAM-dependent methyltransferase [SAR324 cluster bacterium]|nr:class I SAM-dependent methyltransferase [SAR324 cluster bacterium]MBL7034483.1 class I SAM-dependent methyltransferase [SAR324 cluster bacterium]
MSGSFYSKFIFPYLCELTMSGKSLSTFRLDTLQETSGQVLEIGFGTGLNLPHYPDSVYEIDAVDVNPQMHHLAQKRIANSKIIVTNYVLSGEQLPMDDASYDYVTCTFTLCSIPDVKQALSEINRVLKPGGVFVFLEHGLSDVKSVQTWQHRLNPLQKRIGDGCHLNRKIDDLVQDSSFVLTSLNRFQLPSVPRFLGHCYQGIATKSQSKV